ncbi:entericidin A/B family lipoprotein [Niveispirillum sp. BGYR6]|uniref:entericidin A/B family lipoprotein n=1 Tax=Niveispirillum sp. BGYR6 TaxID=2971249 RepID=UPI0022B9A8FB|nr:entericidin A/B family lipoprotein [Niveispirillum sp. BGYR6]MDG5497560.1 entericidin A/B family lipoprotein [Niveispirillum sp. BGYR6]
MTPQLQEVEMTGKTLPFPLLFVMLFTATPLLNACHTMAGAGEDISKTGTAIEKSAEKHTP